MTRPSRRLIGALCLLAGLLPAVSGAAAPPRGVRTKTRILLIGLDGADWQIAGRLIEAGRLPHLARLRAGGAWGDLRSSPPMLSPLLWTSMATGKPPAEHGIIDFLVRDPRTGAQVPIASTFRKTRALWNILSESGRRSDFIAWWATWPAEEIDGHIVSERFAYSLFGYQSRPEDAIGLVSPASWLPRAESARVKEDAITLADLRRFAPFTEEDRAAARARLDGNPVQAYADPLNHLTRILASTRTYHALALGLLKGGSSDLLSIYYQGIDEVCHRFAQYIAPRPEWVDPVAFEKYRNVVERFYEYQDELLGELLAAAGKDFTVVVVSDHGFLNGSDRPTFPPDIELKAGGWHRLYGIVAMAGPGIRPGRLEPVGLLDITPTLLYLTGLPVPTDMPGRPVMDAIDPAFRSQYPLATIASYEDPGSPRPNGTLPGSSAQLNEEMLARLRSLGYISASGIDVGEPQGDPGAQATVTNLINMATLSLQSGDPLAAEESARALVADRPENSNGHALLAEALLAQDRYAEALVEVKTALNLTQEPTDRLVERYAQISRRLGTLDEARTYFLRYISQRQGRAEPWVGLGFSQSMAGDPKGALASFLRALEINPRSAAAMTGLFNLFDRGDRSPEILSAIRKAASANPDSAAHRTLLGMIEARWGDRTVAEAELRRALELDPERDLALASLADLLLATGRMDEARRMLERAVSRRADQVEVRLALGRVYAKMRRLGEAARQMTEAARLDPTSASAHAQAGMMLMMQNQRKQAAGYLATAVRLDPALYEPRVHLAVLYHELGNLAGCEDQLKKAIEQRPDDPEPHRLLADLLRETGRAAEAAREDDRAKALAVKP